MRHTITLRILLAFIASNAALAASADAPYGHGASHGTASQGAPAAPRPTFEALDTNRDGRLDKAELARHPLATHAAMADADRNGTLDRREFATLSAM